MTLRGASVLAAAAALVVGTTPAASAATTTGRTTLADALAALPTARQLPAATDVLDAPAEASSYAVSACISPARRLRPAHAHAVAELLNVRSGDNVSISAVVFDDAKSMRDAKTALLAAEASCPRHGMLPPSVTVTRTVNARYATEHAWAGWRHTDRLVGADSPAVTSRIVQSVLFRGNVMLKISVIALPQPAARAPRDRLEVERRAMTRLVLTRFRHL